MLPGHLELEGHVPKAVVTVVEEDVYSSKTGKELWQHLLRVSNGKRQSASERRRNRLPRNPRINLHRIKVSPFVDFECAEYVGGGNASPRPGLYAGVRPELSHQVVERPPTTMVQVSGQPRKFLSVLVNRFADAVSRIEPRRGSSHSPRKLKWFPNI